MNYKSEIEGDCRCFCGQLLAKLVPGGVEIKCRRCHRMNLIAWGHLQNQEGGSHVGNI